MPYEVWDLLHTGILLRFILLSNVIFEFVLIFADNLRVFLLFFGRLVRKASLGLSAKLNTDENMKFESLIFLKSIETNVKFSEDSKRKV